MLRRPLIHRWTPEEDDLIVKLVREGKTSRFIARQLRRSPSAVRVRKQKLPGSKLNVKEERQP
jgi:DNA-binding NarL/FixJ family response regulator